MTEEVLMYRGEKIPVGWYREQYSAFKKYNGTPYFTSEELEKQVQKKVLDRKRDIGRMTGARYEKHGGFHLAFYQKEQKIFSDAFAMQVSDNQAVLIVRKLLRHFGRANYARNVQVRFWGNNQSGAEGWGIRLSHNPSIGLICHEVSHCFEKQHNKKLMRWIKRMTDYCKKHSYWIYIEPLIGTKQKMKET